MIARALITAIAFLIAGLLLVQLLSVLIRAAAASIVAVFPCLLVLWFMAAVLTNMVKSLFK